MCRDCELEGYCLQPFTGTLHYDHTVLQRSPLEVKVAYTLMSLMDVNEVE